MPITIFDKLIERLENNLKLYAGYPPNTNFDYSDLFPLLKYPLNNIGDPFGSKAFFGLHEYEKALIQWFLRLYSKSGDGWGYVTTGGTEGILFGLWNGREKLNHPVVYYSEYAHYAVPKSVRLLNLEHQLIPTNDLGEINYEVFQDKLIKNRDAIFVATIGSTMTSSVDNVAKIIPVLKAHKINYYIHADTAIDGMILPFIDTSLPHKLDDGIDSVSISGHKIIGSPIPCGIVLTQKNYIADHKDIPILGLQDSTITGSRNAFAALILWSAIKKYRRAGFEKFARECMARAKSYCDLFNENGIAAWRYDHSITVVLNKWPTILNQKWRAPSSHQYTTLTALPKLTPKMVNEIIADIAYVLKNKNLPTDSKLLMPAKEDEKIKLED